MFVIFSRYSKLTITIYVLLELFCVSLHYSFWSFRSARKRSVQRFVSETVSLIQRLHVGLLLAVTVAVVSLQAPNNFQFNYAENIAYTNLHTYDHICRYVGMYVCMYLWMCEKAEDFVFFWLNKMCNCKQFVGNYYFLNHVAIKH